MSFQEDEFKPAGSSGFLAEINMTPFVDVCLVLLVIFMVTAPFAISGVDVRLPKTSSGATLNAAPLVLSVTQKGHFYIGKKEISEDALVGQLKNALAESPNKSLFIRADEKVPYGKVMDAMSAAHQAGVEKIGMLGEARSP